MANYNDLLTAINSVIKTNNRREITGLLLQNVLDTMVGSLGANYQLAGFATPTTNPQSPDQNVFYIASDAGVYTQFDNIVLDDGLSFLMWKNGAWTSHTVPAVSQSWVQQNFVSKEWFRKVFRVYDANDLEIVPNDMESVADNIKAMVGLWTNQYLSALGMGQDGGGAVQTLAQLNDVQLGTLSNDDVLSYDITTHKWINKQIQTGVDMTVVWGALAGGTNEQINVSHLSDALQGYVTTSDLGTALSSYATQTWVNKNFITVEWFDKLFQLYNGTEAVANKIVPNGALPVDQTKLNIEAMFGFWTKKYISALGQGDDGTSYTTLAQLNDVTLTNPTANQVLSYNGTHWVNRSIELGSQTLADLTDVVITSPAANQMLGYDATAQKWKNIAISATGVTSVALSMPTGFSITGSPITASGTFTVTFASGYSLPTTAKQSNWDTAYGWGDHADAGYAAASSLSNYLPLAGGTMTGLLSINKDGYALKWKNDKYSVGSNDSPNDFYIWSEDSTARFRLGTNSTERLTVLANGNVGINTTAPSEKLHVNGNIRIGDAVLAWDSTNNAIKVIKADGAAANFYATGGVSALGAGQESGGGGSYLPLSGGTLTGYLDINYNSLPQLLTLKNTSSGDVNLGLRLNNTNGYNIGAYTTASPILYILDTRLHEHVLDINDGTTCLYHPEGPQTGYINIFRTCCYRTNYYGIFFYEHNDGTGAIQVQRESNINETFPLVLNPYGGVVGIGATNGEYKLTVAGSVGATSYNNTSDIRKKNVIKDIDLRLDQIAKAPAFEYYWLDQSIDHDLHVGTSAQYWESVLPQVVTTAKDEIGTKAMQYGVAALISAITVARKVMTHEEEIALLKTRVSALEKENGEQEQLINSLQEELAKFKAA